MMNAPELLTIAQAADWLQCDPITIRRMISRGEIRAHRYGPKLIRIDRAEILKRRRPVTAIAEHLGGGAIA